MIVFFNIDTQKDFMNKDGALYVPRAETIKPNLKKIIEFARSKNTRIFHSQDLHEKTDTELQRNGGPFPDHCMKGMEGQKQIEETKMDTTIHFVSFPNQSNYQFPDNREYMIHKNNFDIFSNPNVIPWIKQTDLQIAFIFGVATDYCIKAAVLGLLNQNIKVIVIEDAIMGVAEKSTKLAIEEMKSKGAIFEITERIINGL